jgi:hypothetical protein
VLAWYRCCRDRMAMRWRRPQDPTPGKDAILLPQGLAADGVSCSGSQWDDYGRLVAVCRSIKDEDIDRRFVAEGWAWAFVKYSSDYVQEEASARNHHLGVWALACDPPWVFRHKRWEAAAQKAPEGCPIKGNILENVRIYHVPWSRTTSRPASKRAKASGGSAARRTHLRLAGGLRTTGAAKEPTHQQRQPPGVQVCR